VLGLFEYLSKKGIFECKRYISESSQSSQEKHALTFKENLRWEHLDRLGRVSQVVRSSVVEDWLWISLQYRVLLGCLLSHLNSNLGALILKNDLKDLNYNEDSSLPLSIKKTYKN
jgi:hypothetical protein